MATAPPSIHHLRRTNSGTPGASSCPPNLGTSVMLSFKFWTECSLRSATDQVLHVQTVSGPNRSSTCSLSSLEPPTEGVVPSCVGYCVHAGFLLYVFQFAFDSPGGKSKTKAWFAALPHQARKKMLPGHLVLVWHDFSLRSKDPQSALKVSAMSLTRFQGMSLLF